MHHSVPDDKKAGKTSKTTTSKSDPSVGLLLPARPSNSEKVYKASTSYDDTASEEIASNLEQSILDDITAVNERNWSPEGPLFRNKASYWEADLPSSAATGKVTCAQFVAIMQKITTIHPDYQVKAIDFHTNVRESEGRAEVYANVETSGFFPGVTQRNVTLCEYHCVEGKWLHAAHRTMQGMDGGRMPFQVGRET